MWIPFVLIRVIRGQKEDADDNQANPCNLWTEIRILINVIRKYKNGE